MVSAGNSLEIDRVNRGNIKGLGTEQTIESKMKIWTTQEGSRIERVEGRWNEKLPDEAFKQREMLALLKSRIGILVFQTSAS